MYHNARNLLWNRISDKVNKCYRKFSTSDIRISTSVGHHENAVNPSVIPHGIMGQPTCHTHPHLIKYDLLTNGFAQSEFFDRRSELVKRLCMAITPGKSTKQQIVIVPSASKKYMTEKIPFVFRQNSNFYYLTGCLEQDSLLVINIYPNEGNNFKCTLFLRGPDEHSELWDGPRTNFLDGKKLFGVDEVLPFSELSSFVQSQIKTKGSTVWYSDDDSSSSEVTRKVEAAIKELGPFSLGDLKKTLHSMRLLKSPSEIAVMRKSCAIGSEAINKAMACTKSGVSEHDIFALVDYHCRLNGAEQLAFPPVVAGGLRATTIHYINNNQLLNDGEMILIDTGCQLSGYNSDISRTWPVSGKFSKYQLILYEIILSLQLKLIKILEDERPSLDHLFDCMCKQLGRALKQEGIIPPNTADSDLITLAYKFCPHHVSHYLGLDVHDSALIQRHIPVKSGMIVTVEPGLYIKEGDTSVRKEFRGIGVRVEDDVLITDSEPEILSASCYKQVKDIESTVGTRSLPN